MNIHTKQFKPDQAGGRPFNLQKFHPQAEGLVGWWPLVSPSYDVREDRSHFSFAAFPIEAGIHPTSKIDR